MGSVIKLPLFAFADVTILFFVVFLGRRDDLDMAPPQKALHVFRTGERPF